MQAMHAPPASGKAAPNRSGSAGRAMRRRVVVTRVHTPHAPAAADEEAAGIRIDADAGGFDPTASVSVAMPPVTPPPPPPPVTPSLPPAPSTSSYTSSTQQRQQRQQQTSRPLIPEVDLGALLNNLLGTNSDAELQRDTLLGAGAVADGGPPRLFTPLTPDAPPAAVRETLPLMFYLPGIDGTGLAASRQFPSLARAFDLRCLALPPADRMPFEPLVELVAAAVAGDVERSGRGRPVYLLGESFGGTLALALAHRLGGAVDRVVLVNPATSFDASVWPAAGPLLSMLPKAAYNALPIALAPLLTNPLAMAAASVDFSSGADPARQASDFAYALLALLPQLSALRLVLPPETLAWRLRLLADGATYVNARLPRVQQRTLVLAGQLDFLIPSADEAARLERALPRARSAVLPLRSHALLQEAGVDLVAELRARGFYAPTRELSNGAPSKSAVGPGASFGAPVPICLPTPGEVDADSAGFLSTLRRAVSPVFYSTLRGGEVVRGLGGVPVDSRPLLLVGPHGYFASDMYPMVQEFLQQRRTLLRGLAHPVIFGDAATMARAGAATGAAGVPSGRNGSNINSSSNNSNTNNGDGGAARFQALLTSYGAVPVSGKSMHRLLAAGEAVLLYPGGAREAFKRKGESYQLIWPAKSEFVRMAARFGATIVPFASVGADEAITQLLDANDFAALGRALPPPLGERLAARNRIDVPAARRGVNAMEEDQDAFTQPLLAPAPPPRFYYLFGEPIETSPELAADRTACDALYSRVKGDVEASLGYLLRKREADPYRDLLPRLAYEAASRGVQAPSFEP